MNVHIREAGCYIRYLYKVQESTVLTRASVSFGSRVYRVNNSAASCSCPGIVIIIIIITMLQWVRTSGLNHGYPNFPTGVIYILMRIILDIIDNHKMLKICLLKGFRSGPHWWEKVQPTTWIFYPHFPIGCALLVWARSISHCPSHTLTVTNWRCLLSHRCASLTLCFPTVGLSLVTITTAN